METGRWSTSWLGKLARTKNSWSHSTYVDLLFLFFFYTTKYITGHREFICLLCFLLFPFTADVYEGETLTINRVSRLHMGAYLAIGKNFHYQQLRPHQCMRNGCSLLFFYFFSPASCAHQRPMEFLPLSPRGFSLTSTVSICSSLSLLQIASSFSLSLSLLLISLCVLCCTNNEQSIGDKWHDSLLFLLSQCLVVSFSSHSPICFAPSSHLSMNGWSDFTWCISSHLALVSLSLDVCVCVSVPPMIWVPNQSIPAAPGGEAVLICNTEAYPISINYWTRDEEESLMPSVKYEIVNSEKSYKVQMTLRIRDLSASDFTTYKCFARNSLGSTQGSIKLYGNLSLDSIVLLTCTLFIFSPHLSSWFFFFIHIVYCTFHLFSFILTCVHFHFHFYSSHFHFTLCFAFISTAYETRASQFHTKTGPTEHLIGLLLALALSFFLCVFHV